MSYYEEDRVRRKNTRDRRRDDYDDMAYDNRDTKSSAIVTRRRDDSVSSVEEVTREFPPGERGAIYRETTIRKQGHRPAKSRSYSDDYDDRYDDRASYGRRRDDTTYVSKRRSKYEEKGMLSTYRLRILANQFRSSVLSSL